MGSNNKKSCSAMTLVELVIAMAVASILALAVGILLVSGQRSWQRTYDSANSQIEQDAQTITAVFASMGRKANCIGFTIYDVVGNTFIPVQPRTSDKEVVSGNAVEFRFWDVELDKKDSQDLMDVTKTATAYAFFYLDGDKLKVDYGPHPPGAVPHGNGARNTSNVTTVALAKNVYTLSNKDAFSCTTLNGVDQGSVRINVMLIDSNSGASTKVAATTLMRNIWPK